MTNGEFYKVTFDEVLSLHPCFIYTASDNEFLRYLFGDRTELTLNEIMALEILLVDKLWIMEMMIPYFSVARIYVYTGMKPLLTSDDTVKFNELYAAITEYADNSTPENMKKLLELQDKFRDSWTKPVHPALRVTLILNLGFFYKHVTWYSSVDKFNLAINKFLAEERR